MKRIWKYSSIFVAIFIFTAPFIAQETVYQNEQEAMIAELQQLREEGQGVGTYEISININVEGDIKRQTIKVTLVDANTKIGNNQALDLQDIELTQKQVNPLQMSDLLSLMSAFAWDIETMATIPVENIQAEGNFKEVGIHKITAMLPSGLSTSATLKIVSDKVKPLTTYQIYYDDSVNNQLLLSFFERFFLLTIKILIIFLFLLPLILIAIQHQLILKFLRNIINIFIEKEQ